MRFVLKWIQLSESSALSAASLSRVLILKPLRHRWTVNPTGGDKWPIQLVIYLSRQRLSRLPVTFFPALWSDTAMLLQ